MSSPEKRSDRRAPEFRLAPLRDGLGPRTSAGAHRAQRANERGRTAQASGWAGVGWAEG